MLGSAGTVMVEAATVTVLDGGAITSLTSGPGEAGTVNVVAQDVLMVSGTSPDRSPSSIDASTQGENVGAGDAGTVEVTARTVSVTNGGAISSPTFGPGNGGNVTVSALDAVMVSGTNPNGSISFITASAQGDGPIAGDAGTVSVTARIVSVTEGGEIVSTSLGHGNGGDVTVTATDAVLVSGTKPDGSPSVIDANAQGENIDAGDAGTVKVEATTISVTNGGAISSTTMGPGEGGSVTLRGTDSITISDSGSGIFTTTSNVGSGGDIILDAQTIALSNSARVSAASTGTGDAGTLTVGDGKTHTVRLENATIRTTAQTASGGDIKVNATELIHLLNSTIESSVQGNETTGGGNINLDPNAIVLQNSQVRATATAGFGGDIDLIGNVVLVDPSSEINASSETGISGSVNIQAPIQNLSGTIAPLPEAILQTATLYGARCAAQKGSEFSSLNVRGRDRTPFEPGDFLLTPLLTAPIPKTATSEKTAAWMTHRLGLPTYTLSVQTDSKPAHSTFPRNPWWVDCRS